MQVPADLFERYNENTLTRLSTQVGLDCKVGSTDHRSVRVCVPLKSWR